MPTASGAPNVCGIPVTMISPKPRLAPTDRSNWPTTRGNSRAMAKIAGTDCVSMIVRALLHVANVSGRMIEKKMTMPRNTAGRAMLAAR